MLAIDPGDMVGFWHPEMGHNQLPPFTFVTVMHSAFLRADFVIDEIVIERMNLRDSRARMTSNLQRGLDVIGCVRWLATEYEIQLVEQWNRDKNQVKNEDLEERGMLKRPLTEWRHANDAARHAVYRETTLRRKGKW